MGILKWIKDLLKHELIGDTVFHLFKIIILLCHPTSDLSTSLFCLENIKRRIVNYCVWLIPVKRNTSYGHDHNKASELVPGSLFPRWNSMWIFARGSLYNSTSLAKVRFATLYWQSSSTSRILKLVGYYVVIGSPTCRRCEISKKLTLNPTLSAKNTPLFLLSDMRRSLQIFAWRMPLHAHVFSFTHNAVVLSDLKCVHPENQMNIFGF